MLRLLLLRQLLPACFPPRKKTNERQKTTIITLQAKIFHDRNGFPMPVATAARVLADALLGQRGRGLSVGTMIMGHDSRGGGGDAHGSGSGSGSSLGGGGEGQLYYVDSDGARVKGRYFSVG